MRKISSSGMGLAISADGVGTKVLIALMVGKYDTVGIYCVAMADEEMFRVCNMGIGFCSIISANETGRVLSIVRAH